MTRELSEHTLETLPPELLREAKRDGFSDARIARAGAGAAGRRCGKARATSGIVPVYKRVDTCAAEFESYTPYLYSTYEEEDEAAPTTDKKVMILGSGPNRIGQGIEFDYCCCHASFALKEDGFETIMVNCNPETVSTDYDTTDRLYFEPLTLEDVLHIVETEKPTASSCSSAVRRRSTWRWLCSAPACRSSAPRPESSTWPKTGSASANCCAS